MMKANPGILTSPDARVGWLNPWRWMLVALAATGAAFALARCTGDGQVPVAGAQWGLLLVGLIAAGVAVWSRCGRERVAGLDDLPNPARGRILGLLALVHGGIALAVSAWVVLKFSNGGDWPGDVGGTLLLWLLTVPWCAWSAHQLAQRASRATPLGDRLETAVLVTQAGMATLMASWALFWGSTNYHDWDSLRLFLAVLAAVVFMAAPLIAASTPVRRFGVSALILLHFAGIVSAVLANPPGPWIALQSHNWIFRPYLTFMYLNNAYRFYSPEPGPSSQLWFRIEYKQGDHILSRWVKLPDMDEQGNSSYQTSVQLTRRLVMTDAVSHVAPVPWTIPNARGEMELAPFARIRYQQLPAQVADDRLGIFRPEKSLEVPMLPNLLLNYQRPDWGGQQILSSFARFVLRQPHPKQPDAVPIAVKIYRVQHSILRAEELAGGADPHDLTLYLPYYMGRYDTEGKLLDPQDPFLYWLLPILRESLGGSESRFNCYVFKHAGDDEWQFKKAPQW